MNTRKQNVSIWLVLLSVFAASCGPGPSPVATVAPATTTPMASSTPLPTLMPTATLSPTPSPTPVPAIGETLGSNNWEATVLQAVFRKSISIAGTTYVPKPGTIGVDVLLKVKNLNPTTNPSTVVANDVILDEQGTAWPATCWGALAVAGASTSDLIDLPFAGCSYGKLKGESMKIDSESYLRFDFGIKATSLGKTITFKFEDLPAVSFIINQ